MSSYSISDAFRLLVEPGSLTEVRALFRSTENPDERICRNQYYFGREAEKVAQDVSKLDSSDSCIGIYFVINPVNPEHYGRNQSRWRPPFETRVESTVIADVPKRKWLLIDCDSIRGSDESATENERSYALRLGSDVAATLGCLGFSDPIVCDSGNGCHLFYPVDLPNDDKNRELIKSFLNELSNRCYNDGARVDPVTFDCQRMARLYGTTGRKGQSTPERPWRKTGIISHPGAYNASHRAQNNKAISDALEVWSAQNAPVSEGSGARPATELAKLYLEKAEGAVAGSGGHSNTFRIACVLVEGFGLSREDAIGLMSEWNHKCQPPWSERELEKKVDDAIKKIDPSRVGSMVRRKDIEQIQIEIPKPPSGTKDATVADLIRLGQSIQWIWPGWIQRGAIVGIAAQPGAGKTRTCADLTKRIYKGMEWPDGCDRTLDKGSKVLWICCDNQWGEIASFPEQFGIPPDSIFLNAWETDPTTGTLLDGPSQFKELEDRIIRTGVCITFVDTVMNSTTHNTMRPEEGVKFFKPLAEIAQRTNTAIVLVTHLSINNEALGRRIVGQCRQMINLEKIEGDPHNSPRRKMFISKSNSVIPNELEVTLKSDGADYKIIDPDEIEKAKANRDPARLKDAVAGGPVKFSMRDKK